MKKTIFWNLLVIIFLLACFGSAAAQDDTRNISDTFIGIIDDLYKEGMIPTDKGDFYYIDDFEAEWAQMYWYQWHYVADMEIKNFVIRAKLSWESASPTPEWADSGCGCVFREQNPENHLKANVALDGAVYVNGYLNDKWLSYGKKSFSRHSTKGSAYLTIIADEKKVSVMVDDEMMATYDNVLITDPGFLAYVVVSGTNKDYGTRCNFEEGEIYIFD